MKLVKESIEAEMKVVTSEIRDDDSYRESWKSNIAMAFVDEYDRDDKTYKNGADIHKIANTAADNFLDNLLFVAESLNDFMNEAWWRDRKLGKECESAIKNSRKLPKDMKEKIMPLVFHNDIHGTYYNNGVVSNLKIPKVSGKSFEGVSLGADKDGFFVFTHRARSKSKPEISKIPDKDIKFIESTG